MSNLTFQSCVELKVGDRSILDIKPIAFSLSLSFSEPLSLSLSEPLCRSRSLYLSYSLFIYQSLSILSLFF